jgi:hypothetical protein
MPVMTPLEPLPTLAPVSPSADPATTVQMTPSAKEPTIDAVGPPPSPTAWPGASPDPRLHWLVAASTGVEVYRDPARSTAIAWGVAVQAEPGDYVSFEVGYLGTSSADLVSTSVEAIGRLTPFRGNLRPYLFAGTGWRHFHDRATHDVGVFPHGVGLMVRRGRWRGEARLTLRPMSDQDYRSVSASTRLGMEF